VVNSVVTTINTQQTYSNINVTAGQWHTMAAIDNKRSKLLNQ